MPPHLPLVQMSFFMHASPSLQGVSSGAFGFEHLPVAGLQVPATWHWSEAAHTTGLLPVQTPLWQVSVCVQALPSLHVVPFATLVQAVVLTAG